MDGTLEYDELTLPVGRTTPEKRGESWVWPMLPVAGQAFDLGTTLHALDKPGAVEVGPVMSQVGGDAGMIATKAISAAAMALAVKMLQKKHPNWAKAASIGGLLTGVIPGVSNLTR